MNVTTTASNTKSDISVAAIADHVNDQLSCFVDALDLKFIAVSTWVGWKQGPKRRERSQGSGWRWGRGWATWTRFSCAIARLDRHQGSRSDGLVASDTGASCGEMFTVLKFILEQESSI